MGLVPRGIRNLAPLAVAFCILAGETAAEAKPVKVIDRVGVDRGEGAILFQNKDFKVTGNCKDNGGGDFTADTFLKAKRDNLSYSLYSGNAFDSDFDAADPKVDITTFGDATGTDPSYEAAEYYDLYAEGRNGRPLNGRMVTGVHLKGADCIFEGTVVGGQSKGAVHAPKRVKADAGETVTVFSNSDFKITGECEDNGGGDFAANTLLAAKREHLVYYLTEVNQFDTAFGPGDGEIDAFADSDEASGTLPDYVGVSFENDIFMEGAGGKVLQARIATGVHVKNADCTFSGLLIGGGDVGQLHTVDRIKVDAGEKTTIFANKDFKVTGRCLDNGGGDFTARTLAAAKRDNLIYYAYNGDPFYDLDFDKADGKYEITDSDATGTDPSYASEDDYSDFFGDGKGGNVLAGRLGTGVHIKGADCTFAGIFYG